MKNDGNDLNDVYVSKKIQQIIIQRDVLAFVWFWNSIVQPTLLAISQWNFSEIFNLKYHKKK